MQCFEWFRDPEIGGICTPILEAAADSIVEDENEVARNEKSLLLRK